MCIVTFQLNSHPDYPLILVQNRDEAYARESESLHFWEDNASILAGRDALRGGTWSGITSKGLFASMTNRPFEDFPVVRDSFSRGKLVTDYLNDSQTPTEFAHYLKDNRLNYDSYQFLFGTFKKLHVYSNATDTHHTFDKGLHSISNTSDDLSQHKTERSLALVGTYLKDHPEPNLDDLIKLFSDTKKAETLETYPKEISFELAQANSSIFIKGKEFGTVNTTAFLVHKSGRVTVKEVRYDQMGPIEKTQQSFQLDN